MSAIRTGTGRHIHYDDVGTGSPILVIPGAMVDRRSWIAPLTAALAAQHRVIVMDLRDGGENAPETNDYTLGDLVGDTITLLAALEIDRIHVIGYSLGGVVAQQLAVDHSDRVRSLVIKSSFSFSTRGHRPGDPMPPPEEWWSDDPVERTRRNLPYLLGPAAQERLDDASLIAFGEADRGNHITWEGLMRQQGAQSGVDLRPRLHEISVPTLILHGAEDPIILLDRAEITAAGILQADLVVLPGVGHVPWIDEPEVVTGTILAFVAKAERPAA